MNTYSALDIFSGSCKFQSSHASKTISVPYIVSRNPSAKIEHEATTSRISEDQLFYCQQRGISTEDSLSLIVNGFCKEVMKELPMEFAVEAQKLIGISLEGSVG